MGLTDTEIADIDEKNDNFFKELDDWLDEAGYPRLNPVIKLPIQYRFITVTNKKLGEIGNITPKERAKARKNAFGGVMFHRKSNAGDAFSFYARKEYNIFLRFGCEISYFYRNSGKHPKVRLADGINYVGDSGSGTISLPEYFGYYKDGYYGTEKKQSFDALRGDDFVKGKDYFLGKFGLKEMNGYSVSLADLYYSFYIAWQSRTESAGYKRDIGCDFWLSIFLKNLGKMFVGKKQTDERQSKYVEKINYLFEEKHSISPFPRIDYLISAISGEHKRINKPNEFILIGDSGSLVVTSSKIETVNGIGTRKKEKAPIVSIYNPLYDGDKRGASAIDKVEDPHSGIKIRFGNTKSENSWFLLLFQAEFQGQLDYLAKIGDYIKDHEEIFRQDLANYCNKNEVNAKNGLRVEYGKCLKARGVPFDQNAKNEFTKKIHRILDRIFAEAVVSCRMPELKEVFGENFSHIREKIFLDYRCEEIGNSFLNFDIAFRGLLICDATTGEDSKLLREYCKILNFSFKEFSSFDKTPQTLPGGNFPPKDRVQFFNDTYSKIEETFENILENLLVCFDYNKTREKNILTGTFFRDYCNMTGFSPSSPGVQAEFELKIQRIVYHITKLSNVFSIEGET
jgi:hypothetical protein